MLTQFPQEDTASQTESLKEEQVSFQVKKIGQFTRFTREKNLQIVI